MSTDAPVSEAIASPAPVNGAPAVKPPKKPSQLAVACVLAAVPPNGQTALILTFANPEQKLVGVADPYLAALQQRLEKLAPFLADLDQLEQLVALAGVNGDAVANKLADAVQLLENVPDHLEPSRTIDDVHQLVTDAFKALRRNAADAAAVAGVREQLEHELRQADGGVQ